MNRKLFILLPIIVIPLPPWLNITICNEYLLWNYSFIYLFLDKPLVSITLGSTLNSERIKEGDDVYFECLVVSKPPVFKVSWKFNVSIFQRVSILYNLLCLHMSVSMYISSTIQFLLFSKKFGTRIATKRPLFHRCFVFLAPSGLYPYGVITLQCTSNNYLVYNKYKQRPKLM